MSVRGSYVLAVRLFCWLSKEGGRRCRCGAPTCSPSNQQNLGTIHNSNLCTEIFEYTSPDEVAFCNASIALSAFAKAASEAEPASFDFEELARVTRVATKNLNKVIDRTTIPWRRRAGPT